MSDAATEDRATTRRERQVQREEPPALTDEDRARLEALRSKSPNPAVQMAQHVRTEEEEAEFSKLIETEKAQAEAAAARQSVPPNPRERLAALQAKAPHPLAIDPAKVRSEGEENEFRRLAKQCEMADRLIALRKQSSRTPDEDAELARLTAEVGPEYLVV